MRWIPHFLNVSMCRTAAVLAAASLLAACTSAGQAAGPQRPWIIAHRGGTADAPENTLAAIRSALSHGVDMIWLSVQLSRDGVPVLYRPADLSALTDGQGAVADTPLEALRRLNAGWRYADPATGTHPYRTHPEPLPTLAEALAAIPPAVPVILDMKALPAAPQAAAVAAVLAEQGAWGWVTLYSTDAAYQQAFAAWPEARMFESRDATRGRLVNVALADRCDPPNAPGTWAGFEMRRTVEVMESFTMGRAGSPARAALWTARSVACLRQGAGARLVAFGVNDAATLDEAVRLGMDAVMVDSPRQMAPLRAHGVRAGAR